MKKETSPLQAKIDKIVEEQLNKEKVIKETKPQSAIDKLIKNISSTNIVVESRQSEIDRFVEEARKNK